MGDQQVAEAAGLHLVPQLVFLSAGDAEDDGRALGQQGIDDGLSAGEDAGDGAAVRNPSFGRLIGQGGGQDAGGGGFQQAAAR